MTNRGPSQPVCEEPDHYALDGGGCLDCPSESSEMEPLDWLLNYVMAHDPNVSSHYWHMQDGHHHDCGCPLEGDDDAR